MTTASLTVCQSQPSSAATLGTVRPPPTWTVAHLAALVRQQAALGRDPVVAEHPAPLWTQPGSTQRIRCFFQASDIGRAIDGQVDVVHHRALFDLGPSAADSGRRTLARSPARSSTRRRDLDARSAGPRTSLRPTSAARISLGWTRTEVLRGCWLTPQPWSAFAVIQGHLRTRWLPAEIRRAAKARGSSGFSGVSHVTPPRSSRTL